MMPLKILACALMGFGIGAMLALFAYVAMAIIIGLACAAVFVPATIADSYKGWTKRISCFRWSRPIVSDGTKGDKR
jgi:uncharacterized membrane protein